MPVKDNNITLIQLAVTALVGTSTIIVGFTGYVLRDLSQSVNSMAKDLSAMRVQNEFLINSYNHQQACIDDLSAALYNHIAESKIKKEKATK
jgi:hypothetical protein